jgi:hypothetical protein
MSHEANQVLAGFFRLSTKDQQEVFNQISAFLIREQSVQKVFIENFVRKSGIALDPIDTGRCPCCGK